jgi:hypothetical protein
MRRIALAALVFTCTGCASLTLTQQESLEEIQALADVTARAYQFPPVKVSVGGALLFESDVNLIQVTPAILDAPLPIRDVAVARLLAFMVVRPPKALSAPHEREINQRFYPASNVVAVDILIRVKGLPESTAVREVHTYMAEQARGMQAEKDDPAYRTRIPHPCFQIKAFVREFPRFDLGLPEWCR